MAWVVLGLTTRTDLLELAMSAAGICMSEEKAKGNWYLCSKRFKTNGSFIGPLQPANLKFR